MMANVPDPMLPQLYRVQRVRREIPDTFTLELEPGEGVEIPPFACGQFNMLYVFGVGEIPISISGDPARRRPLVHTTRAVGTVSKAMRELKPEDVIGVRGPFGSHWPIERAMGKDVVMVAGGIGLAPCVRPCTRSSPKGQSTARSYSSTVLVPLKTSSTGVKSSTGARILTSRSMSR
jgi:NAD(P)H-flavin reductase